MNTVETKRKFIFKSEVLGQLAHWSVRLSSYIPPYLPELLARANDYLFNHPIGDKLIDNDGDEMYEITNTDIYQYFRDMTHSVPAIARLNLRKEEIEAGLIAEDDVIGGDSNRRFRPSDKNSYFVDLGALARNISNSIEREWEWNNEKNKTNT